MKMHVFPIETFFWLKVIKDLFCQDFVELALILTDETTHYIKITLRR